MEEDPQRLVDYARERGVEVALLPTGTSTATVEEAATALGVDPSQIVKSLLFQGKDGRVVLAVVRGDTRVDRRKLSAVTGLKKPQLAPAQRVVDVTGYPPGATPPVGHRTPVDVIVDRAVLERPVVYGGGGGRDMMLRICSADIVRLTRATVADIADAVVERDSRPREGCGAGPSRPPASSTSPVLQ